MLDAVLSIGLALVVWVAASFVGLLIGLLALFAFSIPLTAVAQTVLYMLGFKAGFGTRLGVAFWWLFYLGFAIIFVYWQVAAAYSARFVVLQVPWVEAVTKLLFSLGVLIFPNWLLWRMWRAAGDADLRA